MTSSSSLRLPAFILLALCLATTFETTFGHGWLTTPTPRFVDGSIRNSPISQPWGQNQVCRNTKKGSATLTVTAGKTTPVKWDFSANHVGDCFMYLSYDGGTKWFKIAQWAKCNTMNHQTQQMMIPSYLPSCDNCIMRYEWYALHVWPTIELYIDCIDVKIIGSSSGRLPTPQVTIPGHLPLNGGSRSSPKYRNEYDSSIAFFFTGPAVATLSGSGGSGGSGGGGSSTPSGGGGSSTPSGGGGSSTPSGGGSSTPSGGGGGGSSSSVTITIVAYYRITLAQYNSNSNYKPAMIRALALNSRPNLDISRLSIYSVKADGSRIKVTFKYRPVSTGRADETGEDVVAVPPEITAEATEIADAIAAGQADNSTETMEMDEETPIEVTAVIDEPETTTTPTSSTDNNIAIYAGAGAGGFVLIAAIGFFVHRYRKQQDKQKRLETTIGTMTATAPIDVVVSPSGTTSEFHSVASPTSTA